MLKLSVSNQTKLIKTDDFSSVFNFRKRIAGKYLVFHYKYEDLRKFEDFSRHQDQSKRENICNPNKTAENLNVSEFLTLNPSVIQQNIELFDSKRVKTRVGLAVAKKVAKRAVDRNYMKRVLRELLYVQRCQFEPIEQSLIKVDLVIRVQKIYAHQQFLEIKKEFNYLAKTLLQKLPQSRT